MEFEAGGYKTTKFQLQTPSLSASTGNVFFQKMSTNMILKSHSYIILSNNMIYRQVLINTTMFFVIKDKISKTQCF